MRPEEPSSWNDSGWRTRSPMTITWSPARLKAAQEVRPRGGVNRTPAAVTARSARGARHLDGALLPVEYPLRARERLDPARVDHPWQRRPSEPAAERSAH